LSAPSFGCDGCKQHHPYTPYTLGDSPSAATSSSASVASTSSAGVAASASAVAPFAVVAGAVPHGDGKTWDLGGRPIPAPAGRTFGVGLTLDLDGDSKVDLLAWARSSDSLRGELWFVPGGSPDSPKAVVALPADLSVPGCTLRASIAQVGPHAIALDLEPRCPSHAHDKAPRWIALLRPRTGAAPDLGMELRAAAMPEGETLRLDWDTRDRDDDGREDVAIAFTLTVAPKSTPISAQSTATIAFLDRPAGLSRDATEPEASLKAAASAIAADAKKRSTAARAVPASIALRALRAAICDETGRPLVTTPVAHVKCGDGSFVETAAVAEVEAGLNLGEPATALSALLRLDAMGKPRKDVDKLFARTVPSVTAALTKKLAATPVAAGMFSSLAFLPSGDVVVRTASGSVRAKKEDWSEEALDPMLGSFRDKLVFPDDASKWALLGASARCSEALGVARFKLEAADASANAEATEIAVPAITSARCTDGAELPMIALGSTAKAHLVAVGSDLVAIARADAPKSETIDSLALPTNAPVPLGAARSPDGSTVALATPRGVLVLGVESSGKQGKAKLWTGPEIEGVSACVPANGGARIACMKGGAAIVLDAK
jgi:hypothetical protein